MRTDLLYIDFVCGTTRNQNVYNKICEKFVGVWPTRRTSRSKSRWCGGKLAGIVTLIHYEWGRILRHMNALVTRFSFLNEIRVKELSLEVFLQLCEVKFCICCFFSVCKSCIIKYLQDSDDNQCPVCAILIHETNPFELLRYLSSFLLLLVRV